MAHSHSHDNQTSYYVEQIFTIAVCGAIAGVCITLYATGSIFNLLKPDQHLRVLFGGVGLQSTRFYLPFCTGTFSCNNFTSSHHFLVDIGGGIRYYVWGHFFVRPDLHYYHIVNNTNDFSSNNVIRVGASIGYTIGPD